MDVLALVEWIGEAQAAALLGLLTGVIFGVAAQRSRFCLRAASVEFARGRMGDRIAVWFLTFSTAVVWVQGAQLSGLFRASDARMMAVPGSWSGAVIGGLIFGAGMVLARGCPGRLLVLAATGNLRAITAGLVFAVAAQMSLSGMLSGTRTDLAALWTTQGGHNMNLLTTLGLPSYSGLMIGLAFAALALVVSRRNRIGASRLIFASGVGFAVAVGWVSTFALATVSFDPVAVTSATFSGPSANTLMYFLVSDPVLNFDIGLVPGVFLGAFLASYVNRELSFQGFEDAANMRRMMTGALMMGFGAMLAGGCSIGNGVTGASIFAGTAWLALFSMWIGAMMTDFLVDQHGVGAQPA